MSLTIILVLSTNCLLTRGVENICDSLRTYAYLRSIMLSLDVTRAPRTLPAHNVVAARELEPLVLIKEQFSSLLRSIMSDYMHTISIQLAPTLEQDKEGIWCFTYHSTRERAVDLLFGEDIRDIFMSGPLVNLALLRVHVQENSSKHGPAWWSQTLRERLGTVPREIRVHVDYCTSPSLLTISANAYDRASCRADAPEVSRGRYSYEKLWS